MAKKNKVKEHIIKWKNYLNCTLYRFDEWFNLYSVYNDTFRSSVSIYVWDIWEEWTLKFFKDELPQWASDVFDYNSNWNHLYNKNYWSIIWLRQYDISVLVHELIHAKQKMFDDRWIDDYETEAYYVEMLLASVLSIDAESGDNLFKYRQQL